MKSALALLFLVLPGTGFAASDPGLTFSGTGVSLGRYPRVTAKITFDRSKAAAGGLIFVVDRPSPADDEAIRLAEAVIFTSGGLLGRGAVAARTHLIPAVSLRRARWAAGPALSVEVPVFGPSRKSADGLEHRPVQGATQRLLKEDEVVTVDAAEGLLLLYPPEVEDREYDLAQAVRAFAGLRDPDSLIHWFEDRAEAGAPLALRLAEELASRAAAGTVKSADLERALKGIKQALSPEGRRAFETAARGLAESIGRDEGQFLAEAEQDLKDSAAQSAAARIVAAADARWRRYKDAAAALGAAPGAAAQAYAAFTQLGRKRLAALKGKDGGWRDAAASSGAPAPAGGRLGPEVYRSFVQEDGLEPLIQDVSDNAGLDLRRKAERIHALFSAAKLDADSSVAKAILSAAPDSEFLHIETPEDSRRFVPRSELLPSVKRAWASYWNAGALGARKRRGEALSAEVVVEAALPADVSGIVFSRDPASLSRDRVVVEAAWGEREGMDAGAADHYVLDRAGRQVLPAEIADKRTKFLFDNVSRSVKPSVVPPGLSLERCLSNEQLVQLARAARALDNQFGRAISAEFAWSGGKVYILSAAPVAGQDAVVLPDFKPEALPAPDVAPVKPLR